MSSSVWFVNIGMISRQEFLRSSFIGDSWEAIEFTCEWLHIEAPSYEEWLRQYHIARASFANVFKNYGISDSIDSNKCPKFTSKFWKSLMELCVVQLKMSSSLHPQADDLSEIMNGMVVSYLRCCCIYHQDNWNDLHSGLVLQFSVQACGFEL